MSPRARWIALATLAALVVLLGMVLRHRGGGIPSDREFDTLGPHATHAVPAGEGPDLAALKARVEQNPRDVRVIDAYVHAAIQAAPAEATDYLDGLRRRAPRHYYALFHLALAWQAAGETTRALRFAAEAQEVRDTAEVNFLLGILFQATAKPDQARAAFQRSLQLNPANPHARAHLQSL